LDLDSDGVINGQILTADIENIIELNVGFKGIEDLTGIEDFSSLEILDVSENFLFSINVSQNLLLKKLNCYENWLSELDVTNNVFLEELYCGNSMDNDTGNRNEFQTINLSNNPALKILDLEFAFTLNLNINNCSFLEELYIAFTGLSLIDLSNNNDLNTLRLGYLFIDPLDGNIYLSNPSLTEIDLSQNISLVNLYSSYTFLEAINLKNGANSILMANTTNSPNLYCIQVDNAAAATNGQFPYSNWQVDPQVIFLEEECSLNTTSFSHINFSIYPNPVTESLFIGNKEIAGEITALVYSLNGKLLHTQNLESTLNEIDVKQLKAGVYFLVLTNETGIKKTMKFIKK